MTFSGWSVFDSSSTSTTTSTITYSDFTTTAYPVASMSWAPEGTLRPIDALTWLRQRVDEVCDLGRLDA